MAVHLFDQFVPVGNFSRKAPGHNLSDLPGLVDNLLSSGKLAYGIGLGWGVMMEISPLDGIGVLPARAAAVDPTLYKIASSE